VVLLPQEPVDLIVNRIKGIVKLGNSTLLDGNWNSFCSSAGMEICLGKSMVCFGNAQLTTTLPISTVPLYCASGCYFIASSLNAINAWSGGPPVCKRRLFLGGKPSDLNGGGIEFKNSPTGACFRDQQSLLLKQLALIFL